MSDERIGDYTLTRLLGRGTMGMVYLAHVSGRPEEIVAVKRVHTLASDDDRERLRREARVMQTLVHPHVMTVLDVIDEPEHGDLALVMPHASGGSLTQRLADGPLDATDTARIAADIADALAVAHDRGIVHRDVKPSNVLFDADGTALLADFGIARNAAHTNLTRTDLAIGTAAYLDPEVADGAEPNPASDQYALGVVAYEALTGAPPFSGSSPLSVLKAADRADFTALDRERFGAVAEVVERAMARRSADRFTSAREFGAALRDAVGRPASIATGSTPPSAIAVTPDGPGWHDATTTFARRRVVVPALADAEPVAPTRRRKVYAAAAIAAVIAGTGGAAALRRHPTSLRALPVPALPTCSAQTDAQCIGSYVRTSTGVKVNFASGESTQFDIARSGDSIRVANFFCGARATAAIYRPDDGLLFYLSNWPDPSSDERSEASVDATGIKDATMSVGDTNHDGCADVALDADEARTWFLPSAQTERLQRAALTVHTRSDR